MELKEIKLTINKSNKNHELKALQQLDLQTKELSSKVSQLKKVNMLINNQNYSNLQTQNQFDRTPLRS